MFRNNNKGINLCDERREALHLSRNGFYVGKHSIEDIDTRLPFPLLEGVQPFPVHHMQKGQALHLLGASVDSSCTFYGATAILLTQLPVRGDGIVFAMAKRVWGAVRSPAAAENANTTPRSITLYWCDARARRGLPRLHRILHHDRAPDAVQRHPFVSPVTHALRTSFVEYELAVPIPSNSTPTLATVQAYDNTFRSALSAPLCVRRQFHEPHPRHAPAPAPQLHPLHRALHHARGHRGPPTVDIAVEDDGVRHTVDFMRPRPVGAAGRAVASAAVGAAASKDGGWGADRGGVNGGGVSGGASASATAGGGQASGLGGWLWVFVTAQWMDIQYSALVTQILASVRGQMYGPDEDASERIDPVNLGIVYGSCKEH
ncbi:hypothetical protein BJ912DRAFT_929281 [Pholiota molesta]|nr:hypothetical protein BJ912DRAFT_929281 [Pholiota molesta]